MTSIICKIQVIVTNNRSIITGQTQFSASVPVACHPACLAITLIFAIAIQVIAERPAKCCRIFEWLKHVPARLLAHRKTMYLPDYFTLKTLKAIEEILLGMPFHVPGACEAQQKEQWSLPILLIGHDAMDVWLVVKLF